MPAWEYPNFRYNSHIAAYGIKLERPYIWYYAGQINYVIGSGPLGSVHRMKWKSLISEHISKSFGFLILTV